MTISIHPLQESSVKLLRALYLDKHLAITPAMLSIANGHYPSIEHILDTLQHYKNDDLVDVFVRENECLISDAKNKLSQTKPPIDDLENMPNSPFEKTDAGSIFDTPFEFVSAYKCMKAIALKDIEEALSSELSRLCGDELILEIESIQECVESFQSSADLRVHIKIR